MSARTALSQPTWWVVLSLGLVGCAARAPALGPAEPPAAIRDLASEFLSGPCAASSPEAFAAAWLAYEERHWPVYQALYHRSADSRAERGTLAAELAPRQREMCGHVRAFLAVAPGVIAPLRERVAGLLGVRPTAEVLFTVPLQWTDGRADELDGREVIALSARHDTFASTAGLAATVAHELAHDAQTLQFDDRGLSRVARALYREGRAVFAVQQLFPELGGRALGLDAAQLVAAEAATPAAAAALLPLLADPDAPPEAARRFFQGGVGAEGLPPRMGYVLGARVFADIARGTDAGRALATSPEAFQARAAGVLARLSGGAAD